MGAEETEDFRQKVFVGRGTTVEEAVQDAYEEAKKASKRGHFDVLKIYGDGDNPITWYGVLEAKD